MDDGRDETSAGVSGSLGQSPNQIAEILKAVTSATAELIFVKDRSERYLFANSAFSAMMGKREDEIVGRTEVELFSDHPVEDRLGRHDRHVLETGVPHAGEELVNVRGEDRIFWSSQLPYRDASGEIVGVIGVARDITESKRVEWEVMQHRERLTELVKEKTAELAESDRRLRFADRMATMGTLSAGIGHDLGNLLLPIRARLDVLDARAHDDTTRQDLKAIRVATDYLRRLTNALRSLSANAESYGVGTGSVLLGEWWPETEPLLRNAVPVGVAIMGEVPASAPLVQISSSVLTQAVLNLVQNAGEAHDGRVRADRWIQIRCQVRRGGREVELEVADNGPGMADDVKERCLEPFYSTKTRSFSNGLGLSLVHGAVTAVGGHVEIESLLGAGTKFRLVLPIVATVAAHSRRKPEERPLAWISVRDPRRRAHVRSVLNSLKLRAQHGRAPLNEREVQLWVTDGEHASPDEVLAFVDRCAECHAVLLTEMYIGITHERVVELLESAKPSDVRDSLHRLATRLTGAPTEHRSGPHVVNRR